MAHQTTIRVPAALMRFLEGTQAYANYSSGERGQGDDTEVFDLITKLWPLRTKRGGTKAVDLTATETSLLVEYADYMVNAAQDADSDDSSAKAERSVGRRFIRTYG